MKVVPDLLRQRGTDAGSDRELIHRCQLNCIDGIEVGQQISDPFRTQPRNVGKSLAFHPLTTLLTMEADRKTMGFVAQTTEQGNSQLVGFTVNRLTLTRQKDFFPLLGE